MRLRRGRHRGPPVRAGRASARSVPPPPARLPEDPALAAGASPGRRSARLGGGSGGSRHLPPDPRMAPKLSDSVERLRAAGNQSFRNGQFSEAAALYSRALRVMQEQGTRRPRSSAGPPLSRPPDPSYPPPAPSLPPGASIPRGRPTARPPARSPRGHPARNFRGPSFRLGGGKSRGFATGPFPLNDRSETYCHSNGFFYHFLVMVKTLSLPS